MTELTAQISFQISALVTMDFGFTDALQRKKIPKLRKAG